MMMESNQDLVGKRVLLTPETGPLPAPYAGKLGTVRSVGAGNVRVDLDDGGGVTVGPDDVQIHDCAGCGAHLGSVTLKDIDHLPGWQEICPSCGELNYGLLIPGSDRTLRA